jgi:hypothetical protein
MSLPQIAVAASWPSCPGRVTAGDKSFIVQEPRSRTARSSARDDPLPREVSQTGLGWSGSSIRQAATLDRVATKCQTHVRFVFDTGSAAAPARHLQETERFRKKGVHPTCVQYHALRRRLSDRLAPAPFGVPTGRVDAVWPQSACHLLWSGGAPVLRIRIGCDRICIGAWVSLPQSGACWTCVGSATAST